MTIEIKRRRADNETFYEVDGNQFGWKGKLTMSLPFNEIGNDGMDAAVVRRFKCSIAERLGKMRQYEVEKELEFIIETEKPERET